MVSVCIVIHKPDQFVSVFKTLLGTPELNMVRCKNNLFGDDQFVSLECIYLNKIVVEIIVRCGRKPINQEASALLNQFKCSESIPKFKEAILTEMTNLAEKGKIYMPLFNKQAYEERLVEIAEEQRCIITEDKLTQEEMEHYMFNQKPHVQEMVARFKSYNIPLVDGFIFEKDYSFLESQELGQMFQEACDRRTIYQFFSAKKHDGRLGLNTANAALRGPLNLGLWQTPFPAEAIQYNEDIYPPPSSMTVAEYSGIHDNKLFYKAFDLPPGEANNPMASIYPCDRSVHGTRSCEQKLCWYYMEFSNLIQD